MHLKVGDHVVHPTFGIGHVVKIEEKQFSEKGAVRLYYQVTMPNRNTTWIPVEDKGVSRLRLVIAKSDLDRYRNLLKSRPVLLEGNRHHRHLDLVSRLKLGSFQVTCEVVRELTLSDQQKPLGVTARTLLRTTRDRLYQEWAVADGISIDEATTEVRSLLWRDSKGKES